MNTNRHQNTCIVHVLRLRMQQNVCGAVVFHNTVNNIHIKDNPVPWNLRPVPEYTYLIHDSTQVSHSAPLENKGLNRIILQKCRIF